MKQLSASFSILLAPFFSIMNMKWTKWNKYADFKQKASDEESKVDSKLQNLIT